MADFWASQANGNYYKDLRGAAGIAYDAWIIDTISNSGASAYATTFSAYGTNTNSTYGQAIKRVINNDGYTGEHSISIGGNISNKLFFGATLGISQLRYTGHYQHIESDPSNVIPDFKNFVYTDHFEASGTGYSGQIGLIFKPIDFLRLGAALHTPTFYRVSESFYDNITSEFDDFDKYEASNDKLSYKYSFTTPLRYNLGIAFQIKKFALLSLDYEHLNYSKTRFGNASDSYDYSNENQDIQSILKAANNFRFGAEFRIDKYYLRTGYSYYGKAFKASEVNKDLFYQGVSFGLGMRQQNFYVDMAYSVLFGTSKYYMYNDPPYLAPASINSSKNSFTLTMGVKF